jgi:hypothetical protein
MSSLLLLSRCDFYRAASQFWFAGATLELQFGPSQILVEDTLLTGAPMMRFMMCVQGGLQGRRRVDLNLHGVFLCNFTP